MIKEKSLVVYKNRPALVAEVGDKIAIRLEDGTTLRVREKDIELLHAGPLQSLAELRQGPPDGDLQGAWELLEGAAAPLAEMAELAYGAWSPRSAWAAYEALMDGLFFTGTIGAVRPKSAEERRTEAAKRGEKEREAAERDAFIVRLKEGAVSLPEDGRRLQDVEALALGKTEKSRTMKELGRSETPQEAHRLLLSVGYWKNQVNPHPSRFGLSLSSAAVPVQPPPEEDRTDLTGLPAYAIDNEWSADPDDAVSLQGDILYVHVADPAAVVVPGSPADREARDRGATLYLPEGSFRMLAEEALPRYALGLGEVSPALTFKMRLAEDGTPVETEILKSLVKVRRLSYAQADGAAAEPDLAGLFALAERNLGRRKAAGAVAIDLPEVHLSVADGTVLFEPIRDYRSASMVRECMLLAGEGAARWAIRNLVPFPYVAQELGDLPAEPLGGLAGSYQLRRCMRPRRLSAQVGTHGGLGLAVYTQVTSPLRRYTDLLAHQQIRAVLAGRMPLSSDEILAALAAGEAAASATVQAERASRAHWTMVYLSERIGAKFSGILVERRGNRGTVLIPELALETQVNLKGDASPNDELELTVVSVKIPELEAGFCAN